MASGNSDELAILQAELQALRLENERLKAEKEITLLERELSRRQLTSTPVVDSGIGVPNLRSEVELHTQSRTGSQSLTGDTLPTPILKHVLQDNQRPRVSFDENPVVRKRLETPETKPEGTVQESVRKSTIIKPATYDGTGSWLDYQAHFDACATINRWTDKEKGLYLAVSLRGQAQGVFGNLASKSNDYSELVNALQDRFQPPNQTELYRVQLRERRQKAKENLSELAQDIRRLTNLAYPTAPSDLKETLAKEQFIDSLHSSEIRIRTKQARPQNLNDAVRHAIEFEAYEKAERKRLEGMGSVLQTESKGPNQKTDSDIQSLKTALDDLKEQFKQFAEQSQRSQTQYSKENRYQSSSSRGSYRPRPRFQGQNNYNQQQRNRQSQFYRQRNSRPNQNQDNRSQDNTSSNSKQAPDKVINNSSLKGSGLYVKAHLDGAPIHCLVDTGATLSVLSYETWEQLQNKPQLFEYNREIVTASGDPHDVKGLTTIFLDLNGVQYRCRVLVADIQSKIILGLDFLKRNKGRIDVEANTLELGQNICPLNTTGTLGCFRLLVTERTEVPARSEIILKAKLDTSDTMRDSMLVEPSEILLRSEKGLIARGLVSGHKDVPVRLMNVSNETQIFYPGTHIANATSVSEVHKVKSQDNQPKPTTVVPEHLKELYSRAIHGLTSGQQKDVARVDICNKNVQTDEEVKEPQVCLHQCRACGVHFEAITMMYIHRGWHTVDKEFKCNICAKQCENRMEFFIHLTMGHGASK